MKQVNRGNGHSTGVLHGGRIKAKNRRDLEKLDCLTGSRKLEECIFFARHMCRSIDSYANKPYVSYRLFPLRALYC